MTRPLFTLTASGKLHELLVRYFYWTVLQHRRDNNVDGSIKYLTKEDLERAKSAIAKLVQNEVYQDEIGDLKKRGMVKTSSGIVRLRQVLVNGVLRVGGHISEALITLEAKFPMTVPQNIM